MLWATALFIFAGMVAFFWPGVGTYEVLQFAQQRKLPVMNDWKSPFVAVIYWLSDDFFKSTGPVLLAQQALFWSGLALLTQNTLKSAPGRIIFLGSVAILPLIWVTEGLLWKEAWTLSFLSFSIGATFAYLRNLRRIYLLAAIASAIMIVATRHNAILLSLPTFYVAARKIADRATEAPEKKRRIILGSIFIFLVVLALGFTWAVNKKGIQRCHIWHHSLLWDLSAISVFEERMFIPDPFRKTGEDGSLKHIRSHFTPYNSDPLFFYNQSPLKLYGTAWSGCDEQPPLAMLLESWLKTVIRYPKSYLRHRGLYMLHLLNIPDVSQDKFGKAYYRIDSEFSPIANQSSRFEHLRTRPVYKALVQGIPLRGGIYPLVFFLSVIGLSGRPSIKKNYLWMLWISGVIYFASFVIIGSGAVSRYLAVYGLLGPAILAGRWGSPLNPQDLGPHTTLI